MALSVHGGSVPEPGRIGVVGHVTRDTIRCPGAVPVTRPGGLAFYAGAALGHLGAEPRVCTRLASADRSLLGELCAAGAHVRIGDGSGTTAFENVYAGGGPDDDRVQRVTSRASPMEEGDLAGWDLDWWMFGPLTPEDVPPSLVDQVRPGRRAVDPQGWLRHIDPDGVVRLGDPTPEAKRCLARVDVVKVSEGEGRRLTGEDGPVAIAEGLAALGPAEVLVTRGAAGAYLYAPGNRAHVGAARPRRVVDPTGCGDTFLASYVWARTAGVEPLDAARVASAGASLALERSGALRASASALWRRAETVAVTLLA